MPEIFEILSYVDLGIYANEAGQVASEMASLGVPLLLSAGITNLSSFSGVADFFEPERYVDLISKVEKFISLSKSERKKLRKSFRKYCEKRFSQELYFEKLQLAMKAAKVYYEYERNPHNNELSVEFESIKRKIEKRFDEDMALFNLNDWKRLV